MMGGMGLPLGRYKQRVLTRRARMTADGNLTPSALNDWHLCRVWVAGGGGAGGDGIGGGGTFVNFGGAGGGGAGGVSYGRYQVLPANGAFTCTVGATTNGAGNDSSCALVEQSDPLSAATNRNLVGNGGQAGNFQGFGNGGGASGGQQNVAGGRGGSGNGRGGGGGGIGGAIGQNSTALASGDGATGNNAAGIHTEMQAWGYSICCGGNGGYAAGTGGGGGCGGGGGGAKGTDTSKRKPGFPGGLAGGGGGGMQSDLQLAHRPGGTGGAGVIFIIY